MLREVVPGTNWRTLNSWNRELQCMSNVRTVSLILQDPIECIERYLKQPGIRIYSVVSHDPIITPANQRLLSQGHTSIGRIRDEQRIVDAQGEPYIDEFGRYVYIAYAVGTKDDVDMRYDVPTQELFELQHQEE